MEFGIEDFRRLESKVDRLADAVQRLVLIEERQSNMSERIVVVEERVKVNEETINKVSIKLERWINRWIGVCGVIAILYSVFEVIQKVLK
jgi:Fe2+ transport system protein B